MLYELLVGALPFDFHNLRFDEIVHKLHEEDAAKPSTKLRTLGKQSTITARNRCTEAKILARLLTGDLDAITLKAIEKERSRRYGSPSDLAADIKRYLDNEPVLAHAPSLQYQAGKYVRRHRVGISIAVCAVLLLASFAVAQAYALHRVTIERDRADRRLTQIVALANKSLLDVHFAIQRLPGAMEARRQIVTTTLDYLKTLEKDAANDNDLQLVLAGAYLRMGQIQGSPFTASLGDSAGAMKSYLRAADWLRPLLQVRNRDPEVLSVWIDIQSGRAELLNVRGKHDEEALFHLL
jgi:non-specific serine/threonine protein kinase/serine/threonine-protein kinase